MTDQPVSLTSAPAGYHDWLLDLKFRIHTAQQRATLAVNQRAGVALLADRARHSGAAG